MSRINVRPRHKFNATPTVVDGIRFASGGVVTNKPSKYRARRTVVDGITFHSMKEAKRYRELKLLEKAGEVWGLSLQHPYDLGVRGVKLGRYLADFAYYEVDKKSGRSELVIEDVKGFKTPLYRWKKRHVEAQYNITIREI